MIREISRRVASAVLVGVFIATAAVAADEASVAETSDEASHEAAITAAIQADTEAAKATLKQSADFLASQERFAVTTRMSNDVLQPNGQKLEFGSIRKTTVRRPDRIRIDSQTRDGERRSVYFDGEKISIDLPDDDAYIVVNKPGTLDAAIDYLVDDLDTPAPLHEFAKSNFYTGVADRIRSGYAIGTEAIGERSCQHLAFRLAEIDVQIWIEEGDRPLPCNIVITYKHAEASPQFRASFDDWDLSPKASDRIFTYEPPDGAEQLSLQAGMQQARDAAEGK